MRILVDTLSVLPGINAGGETYLSCLLRGLAEVDSYNRYLLVVTKENRGAFAIDQENFEVHTARVENRSRIKRVVYEQFVLPMVARQWKADVVLFPANMMSVMLPLMGIHSVVTIHDCSPQFYAANFPANMPGKRIRALSALTTFAARNASAVVTDSQFSRNEICQQLQADPMKVSVVLCGCPEPSHSRQISRKIAEPYILVVGRTNKHKNLERLVRAFAFVKRELGLPHVLAIAGPEGNGHTDLMRAIEDVSAQEFVRFLGYLSSEELCAAYRNSTLFAMPSLYEGFGFPALEAMQYGVPVLLSTAASLPEVGGDAVLYVDPNDESEMRAAISRLLNDASLRATLGARGVQQARRFSWHNSSRQMLGILANLIGELTDCQMPSELVNAPRGDEYSRLN